MIEYLLKNVQKIIFWVSSLFMIFLWKKKSVDAVKLKTNNESLKERIKKVESISEKVIKNQKKQATVASNISHNRDDFHNWMQHLNERSNRRGKKG